MKTNDLHHACSQQGPASIERGGTRRLAGVVFAFLAIALTGCMLAPVDGQVVTSTSQVVHFNGYTLKASEPVQVETFDGSSWTFLASMTTRATPERQYDGSDLYPWSTDAAVPAGRWRRGTTGFAAQVRARVGSSLERTAYTFTSSWLTCLGANPGLYEFIENCRSPRSPNAFLYTSDYPAGVDLTITSIRRDVGGVLDVSVRNGGRPGRITKIECHGNGAHLVRTVNAAINPSRRRSFKTSASGSMPARPCCVWSSASTRTDPPRPTQRTTPARRSCSDRLRDLAAATTVAVHRLGACSGRGSSGDCDCRVLASRSWIGRHPSSSRDTAP